MPGWNASKVVAAFEAFGLKGTNAALGVYWMSLWSPAGPPMRGAFNPARVRELLPAIGLTEVREDSAMCRLSGHYIDMAVGGELRGHDTLALVDAGQRRLRKTRLTALVDGCVAMSRTRYDMLGASYFADTLQLPFFGTSEDGARQFISHTNWRPAPSDHYVREKRLRGGMPDEYLAFSLA
jgi:hypothetical protein